jgi:dihydroxy-acid dehydratase
MAMGTNGMKYSLVLREVIAGGTIALVQEGDLITIDAEARLLQLEVTDTEIRQRRAAWRQPAPRYTQGVLAKYIQLTRPADQGASTGCAGLATSSPHPWQYKRTHQWL